MEERRTRLVTQMVECVDRCRRMETRLTRFLEKQGFDVEVGKINFKNGVLTIRSLDASLRECLLAIPPGHHEEVDVVHQGRVVCNLFVDVDAGFLSTEEPTNG
jgi:hypothetical protein